jgi:diguanylate cyclase (GGDEF)-like protein
MSMVASRSTHEFEENNQTSRVATFTGVMMFWAAAFVPVYLAMGGIKCSIVLLSGCVIALSILVSLRIGVSTRICGNLLCAAAFYVYAALAVFCGGRWAPTTIWFVSMPVLSMAVRGVGSAVFWSSAGLVAILIFTVMDYAGVTLPAEIGPTQLTLLHSLGLAALLMCFFVLAYVMMRFERRAREVLREANSLLQLESSSDALTNIGNRRYFDRVIAEEWNRHRREQMPLTLILIDLDFFKEFNDLRGHLAGDSVLRLIASAIQAGTRQQDIVARFGGEEFVVVLPSTCEQIASEVTFRIRGEIDALNILHPRSPVSRKVTVSIGTTTVIPREQRTYFDMLRQADEALYIAKAAGRDRVMHAKDLLTSRRSTGPSDARSPTPNPETGAPPLVGPIFPVDAGSQHEAQR